MHVMTWGWYVCEYYVVAGEWAVVLGTFFFFVKQKTAYEMRISDWSSDVCSSDLPDPFHRISGFKAAYRVGVNGLGMDRIGACHAFQVKTHVMTDRKSVV